MKFFLPFVLATLTGCASGTAKPKAQTPSGATKSSVTSLYRPGEVIGYAISDDKGQPIGRSRSLFQRSKSGHLQIRTRIIVGGESREYAMSFDANKNPIRYKSLSSKQGRYEIDFRGKELTVFENSVSRKIPSAKVKHLPLPPDALMLFSLAFAGTDLTPGSSSELKYYDVRKFRVAPMTVSTYLDASQRTKVSFKHGEATLDASGRILGFESAQAWRFTPQANPKAIPAVTFRARLAYQAPVSPAWKDQKIRVGSRNGLLSIPEKLSRWPRLKAPLVVVLSDTGNQDRYGLTDKVDHGTWEIQNHLLEQGYAVLRVDDAEELETAESLKALIEFMMRQSEVNAEKLFVLGHGKGAWMALRAGVLFPTNVVGVGLIASAWTDAPRELKKSLGKTEFPVAVFQGLKDIEVSWKTDSKVLISDLQSRPSGKSGVKAEYYSRVDHLMKEEPKASSQARYEDRSRRVDRRFLNDLSRWLDRLNSN